MAKKDSLHTLIQSLTASEKRYFKLVTQVQAGEKNYMQVFEALDKMPEYDSAALREQFKGVIPNLSYEKQYLTKMLFRALRNFHEDESDQTTIHQGLIDLGILFKKGLFEECIHLANDLYKLALEKEILMPAQEILNRKLVCGFRLLHQPTLEAYEEESKQLSERVNELEELRRIQSRVTGLAAAKGIISSGKDFREIIAHSLLQNPEQRKTFVAKALAFEILRHSYNRLGEMQAAYDCLLRFREIFEGIKGTPLFRPQAYYALLHSLANASTAMDKNAQALQHLQELEAFVAENKGAFSKVTRKDIALKIATLRLMVYDYANRFNEALGVANELNTKYDLVREVDKILLAYFEAHALFNLNRFDEALVALDPNLNPQRENYRLDFILYSRILNCMIHTELGNYKLLPSLVQSIRYFAKKWKINNEELPTMLELFVALSKHFDDASLQQQDYAQCIDKVQQAQSTEMSQTMNLMRWLQPKV